MIEYQKALLSYKEIVKATVDFFTSPSTNHKLFENIKEKSTIISNNMKKLNGETFIKMGYLSSFDFTMYASENKEKWNLKNGIPVRIVEMVLDILQSKLIITKVESMLTFGGDTRYHVNDKYAKVLYERDLIYNVMFGFQYVLEKYKNSIIKIENIDKKSDHSIGTGFIVEQQDTTLIITNKHVLKNAEAINIYDKDDAKLEFNKPYLSTDKDIAIIPLKQKLKYPNFILSEDFQIMSEIITIGYPSIPMTKFAYQVSHKGEVNSSIEDYRGNKLFLISAKTSSGNSGSPVINDYGNVIGIITEELFEKDLFYEKGKLPYYAAIPSIEIIDTLNEYKKTRVVNTVQN